MRRLTKPTGFTFSHDVRMRKSQSLAAAGTRLAHLTYLREVLCTRNVSLGFHRVSPRVRQTFHNTAVHMTRTVCYSERVTVLASRIIPHRAAQPSETTHRSMLAHYSCNIILGIIVIIFNYFFTRVAAAPPPCCSAAQRLLHRSAAVATAATTTTTTRRRSENAPFTWTTSTEASVSTLFTAFLPFFPLFSGYPCTLALAAML